MYSKLFSDFWRPFLCFQVAFFRKFCPYLLTCILNRYVRILDSLEDYCNKHINSKHSMLKAGSWSQHAAWTVKFGLNSYR